MYRGIPAVDADGHVIEPVDLWQRYIDPEFLDQAPRCRGAISVEVCGHRMPDVVGWQESYDDPRQHTQERFRFAAERGYDPSSQLEAMDIEGFDMAVLYPSRGLFAASADGIPPKLSGAICRAYNRWLSEFCATDRKRLLGAAMVALHDPGVAVAEAVHAIEVLGLRSIFLRPNPVNGKTIDHRDFDELYAEAERMGVPIATHEGAGVHLDEYGRTRYDKLFKIHMVSHAVEAMGACMDLIVGGVLARHPRLKCVFLEASAGWAPWWLERMDEHYEGYHGQRECPDLRMLPSEYFRRQCYVAAEVDERAAKYVIDAFGDSNLVMGSDYPHGDGSFPTALADFVAVETLSDEAKRKTLWDNPVRLYNLHAEAAALGKPVPPAAG